MSLGRRELKSIDSGRGGGGMEARRSAGVWLAYS